MRSGAEREQFTVAEGLVWEGFARRRVFDRDERDGCRGRLRNGKEEERDSGADDKCGRGEAQVASASQSLLLAARADAPRTRYCPPSETSRPPLVVGFLRRLRGDPSAGDASPTRSSRGTAQARGECLLRPLSSTSPRRGDDPRCRRELLASTNEASNARVRTDTRPHLALCCRSASPRHAGSISRRPGSMVSAPLPTRRALLRYAGSPARVELSELDADLGLSSRL